MPLPAGVQSPIRCSGGGAASGLWNQIRADVFAHPVQVLASAEGGIQGAAILAGVAVGWYSDAAAGAEEVVHVAETWALPPMRFVSTRTPFASSAPCTTLWMASGKHGMIGSSHD